jgi:hypothetical protein
MRPYLTAKFLRVGNHLINLEVIQQLELRKDDSALIMVPGPRKSFQRIEVPAPAGRKLWEFFSENLVVIDFEPEAEEELKPKAKVRTKPKAAEKLKSEPVEGAKEPKAKLSKAKSAAKAKADARAKAREKGENKAQAKGEPKDPA